MVLDVFIRFNDNLNGAQLDYGDHIKSQLLADIVLGLPRPLSESFHRHGMCTSKITMIMTLAGYTTLQRELTAGSPGPGELRLAMQVTLCEVVLMTYWVQFLQKVLHH